MRRVSSNPNLTHSKTNSLGTSIKKSNSNGSLSDMSNISIKSVPMLHDTTFVTESNIDIEIVAHIPITNIAKCVYMHGFPNLLNKSDEVKDVVNCMVTLDEEKREVVNPDEDKQFDKFAEIVRRRKKKEIR